MSDYSVVTIKAKDVYKIFPQFDKRFKLKESYKVYVLLNEGLPVSCLSVAEEKSNIKIHGCYTPKEMRRKGYLKMLLTIVIKTYSNRKIKADCLPSSIGVFSQCGFSFIKKRYCKGYTLYKVVLEGSEKNG